jgi:uncharacterized repeat protein (TIGR02543 family)
MNTKSAKHKNLIKKTLSALSLCLAALVALAACASDGGQNVPGGGKPDGGADTPAGRYTVAFDSKGGGGVPEQTVAENALAAAPSPAPSKTGYTFGGWFRDKNCGAAWDFAADTVTGDTTLYAYWRGTAGLEYRLREDNTYDVYAGTITGGVAYIQDCSDGFPVTGIGKDAFAGCYNLTGAIIPDSVASVGRNAFIGTGIWNDAKAGRAVYADKWAVGYKEDSDGAAAAKAIAAAKTVKTAKTVQTAETADGVLTLDEGTVGVADFAFEGKTDLRGVAIPASAAAFGEGAFNGTGIWNDAAGDGVVYADNCAVGYKGELNGVLTLRAGTVAVGDLAFYGRAGLTGVEFPDTLVSIGQWAFDACRNLTVITFPASVAAVASGAFAYCNGLTSLSVDPANAAYRSEGNCLIRKSDNVLIVGCNDSVIPDGVSGIGDNAFSGCSGLTAIAIPDSAAWIGYFAFSSCSGLTDVTIGKGVARIGNSAFYNTGIWNDTADSSIVYIDRWAVDYKWSLSSESSEPLTGVLSLRDGTVGIGDRAFYNGSRLTGLALPDSLVWIGNNAFEHSGSLTEITIPASVAGIAPTAFANCHSLTSLSVDPANAAYRSEGNCLIRKSDDVLIAGCSNSVIPDGVSGIGAYAFSRRSGLTEITIPDSVVFIGERAFANCPLITAAAIPASVVWIGGFAFEYCTGLTSVSIPASVARIETSPFANCGNIAAITVDPANAAFSGEGNCLVQKATPF